MLEETFDLLFKDSLDLIDKEEFSKAIPLLMNLLNSENNKVVSRANYHLGYVYSLSFNKEKNDRLAIMHLKNNLNSEFPQPYAYVLYSKIEEDKNIALNYLLNGISKFPDNIDIYHEMFRLTNDKDKLIDTIMEKRIWGYSLLKEVIAYLFNTSGDWDKISFIITKIEENTILSEDDANYLNLIKAYSYLFKPIPDYYIAHEIFIKVIEYDIDNSLCYSPYLGIIYAFIKIDKIADAISYFEKLPLNNSIQDLNDGPWVVIYLQFNTVYKEIFNCLFKVFSNNPDKKNKSKQLYALYLYSPSEAYDIFRYKKSDIRVLQTALNKEFNNEIAAACFSMLCHFKEYIDANKILLEYFINDKDPEEDCVYIADITNNITKNDMKIVIQDTIDAVTNQENFDDTIFATTLFKLLCNRLFKDNSYDLLISLAECLSDELIISSDCAFECAYSYSKNCRNDRAKRLYKELINGQPNNSSAINNLGVILENESKINDALDCYLKAYEISPTEDLYKRNLNRIKERLRNEKTNEIKAIRDLISIKNLEKIGYTDDMTKKMSKIPDVEFRNILLRDLKECAISIIIGQDKSAIVMCGSMIETLLLFLISKLDLKNYDISEISHAKNSNKYPIRNMCLNELLYVAEKEQLIQKEDYHLSQYIRNYRNIVHPAAEKRKLLNISHDDAIIVWTVLKQIINGLSF